MSRFQMMFQDRADAGHRLAEQLKDYKDDSNAIVLGLPRGGVVIAAEIAQELELPMDIVVVRKIGLPNNPETAIGAITQDGTVIWNKDIVHLLDVTSEPVQRIVHQQQEELVRRLEKYRHGRKPLDLHNKTVILVDDGLATGLTMQAAIRSIHEQKPLKIIVAAPVASTKEAQFINSMSEVADSVFLIVDPYFRAVGQYYNHFDQVGDQEVETLMNIVK